MFTADGELMRVHRKPVERAGGPKLKGGPLVGGDSRTTAGEPCVGDSRGELKGEKEADRQRLQQMRAWRREFHAYPELSRSEWQTRKRILTVLNGLEIEVREFADHAGVIGVLQGPTPGPCVVLRADMDALPIREETSVPYRSQCEGVMHACGHDAHMAILLDCACELSRARSTFSGTVKLVFQPAEEDCPEGGAERMIQDGDLRPPGVSAIFGLHVWPDLPTGCVGVRTGPMMAASDRFVARMVGRSAHASQPHKGCDAVVMAAHAVQTLFSVVSRRFDPLVIMALNIGKINGGERYNVIAREVSLEGAVRTLDEETRQRASAMVRQVLESAAGTYAGQCTVEYQFGYPVLSNQEEAVALLVDSARHVLGPANVRTRIDPVLASEDFAHYLKYLPGAFFLLGCAQDPTTAPSLHSSQFDLDETCMLLGSKIMTSTALAALNHYSVSAERAPRASDQ
jgi:amidohydrolase